MANNSTPAPSDDYTAQVNATSRAILATLNGDRARSMAAHPAGKSRPVKITGAHVVNGLRVVRPLHRDPLTGSMVFACDVIDVPERICPDCESRNVRALDSVDLECQNCGCVWMR
jgi:hypothetical protein